MSTPSNQVRPSTGGLPDSGGMDEAMAALAKRRASATPAVASSGKPQAQPEDGTQGDEPNPEEVTQLAEGEQSDEGADEVHADDESAGAEGEGVEGEEQLEAADEGDDDAVVLTLDGEKLTRRDVRDGLLRAADYTRKTQALSEKRRTVEEMEKKYAFNLGRMENAMVAEVERMKPTAELARQNPAEYAAQKAMYEEAVGQLRAFQREGEELMSTVQRRVEAERAEAAAHTNEVLRGRIPGWSNALYYELLNYAVAELGVPKENALSQTDPYFFVLLHKARAYDGARKTAQTKRIKSATSKTLTPGRPVKRVAPKQDSANKSLAIARKTGKVDDALAALRARRAVGTGAGALAKRGK